MTTALITGASSGIGLELARLLAADRHDLILVARNADRLQNLAEELQRSQRVRVEIIASDLGRPDGVDQVLQKLGGAPVDILVNNAGCGEFDRFQDADWADYRQTLQVNMVALTQLTHALLPNMLQRGAGQVVNVASTGAFQPLPWMAVYGASKAYVLSLTEALAYELRHTGVRVLAYCPGATASGFASAAGAEQSNNFKQGRTVAPVEVAEDIRRLILKGRRGVAVHGALNCLMAHLAPMSPRTWVMAIAERTMAPKTQR
ncbi:MULTISPECIES: SDR family oxidoreductase [unclassified Pseudomonas]|uniref:SDR family NAD(P)-dependent oxidoreductase n=1 Tax=unclassified Pseudomonas TaxID=196821 RepID=UPI0007306977|nr:MULTISPECIES: SDR family oxidoreductase [unclassified Pseudomonas]KSW25807.1 hypothetical protein AOX63_19240 [Pseudomonas sp. ADP]OBP12324.1 hypothetical protein BAE52_04960 [Pseudomonas sp. EGD-AKN5]QOF82408.1 SDR family oxidoreductase [Pseudomonas sp. ADPe]GLU42114.1 dehydrogenase [Pseudomonas sp. NBRC 100443]